MGSTAANYVIALGMVGVAALGGAFVVYSEYDDAPGGILIGFLLIIGAAVLVVRSLQRRDQ